VARAFSEHRFAEISERLAEQMVWNLVGEMQLEGRDAVLAACRATSDELSDTTTTGLRFVTTGDGDTVAVDAIGRFSGPDGVSTVSSCDVYEFSGGNIQAITSYAIES
jgi:ketosteroid isomerase-like protein